MPRNKPKACTVCGRAVSDSFVCRRCGRELRELLIGNGWPSRPGSEPNQPGIVWYLRRLRETAYRQASMERSLGARTSSKGYALLPDQRAVVLIARITATVGNWNDVLDRLKCPESDESAARRGKDADTARIHRVANNIPVLRHNCADLDRLLHHLLDYAKDAWRIINRPDDICCGRCPNMLRDNNKDEVECGRMLYAEEYEDNKKASASSPTSCSARIRDVVLNTMFRSCASG